MKKLVSILFFNLNLVFMTFAQNHDYIKTGKLPDYSKSKAYSYIAYLDNLLKKNGKIEKLIESGDKDKAKRLLSNLDLNLDNVRETDASYPLDGFIAKRKMLEAQLNGATNANTNTTNTNTPKTNTVANNNNSGGVFNLPDYSKSRAYSSIDYLNKILKPNGKIEQLLEKGENGRAMDIAEGIDDHMNTIKKQDPSFPVHVFENRRKELVAKATGAYQNQRTAQNKEANRLQALSEKQGLLNRIIINDQYFPYFFGSETNDKNFIEALVQLDWTTTHKDLKAYLKDHPNEAYTFERLSKFETNFQKQQDEFMLKAIQETIDWAYKREQYSKPEARKLANIALTIAKASLDILPNHSATVAIKKDAQKAVDYFAPDYPTDFHKQHAGQIVFAPKPIVNTKETGIQKDFEAGEHVYAMAYLDGGWADYTYASDKIVIAVYVDGAYNSQYEFSAAHLDEHQMFLDIELLPNPSTVRHQGPETYAKGLASISPRKHEVEVHLRAGYGNTIAVGKFTLDASNGREKLQDLYKEYKAFNASNVFLSKSKRNDPALEKAMLTAFKATGWEQVPAKATIFDADWRTVRNTYTGAIMFRAIRGEVSAKSPKGHCLLYFVDFMQDYQGGGKFSSTVKVRQTLGNQEMDCKNLHVVK